MGIINGIKKGLAKILIGDDSAIIEKEDLAELKRRLDRSGNLNCKYPPDCVTGPGICDNCYAENFFKEYLPN